MRSLTVYSALILFSLNMHSQNPITPPGFFLADPSGHVWDGTLYLYGSNDESLNYWCSREYHFMSTDDLVNWTVHYNSFASGGINDQVPYNDNILYAPDCVCLDDTCYLYYCQPGPQAEGVAFSSNPAGPFRNGRQINLYGYDQIDPSVFIDDDGKAYYTWGQFTAKMARLRENMTELDPASIRDSVLTEGEHYFHEGGFIFKRKGIYYFVYADMSREHVPSCLGYATAEHPMGPYTYRGVIIDNDGCDPANWNNHGSVVQFGNKWYVLYHRTIGGSPSLRKTCIEPIRFLSDGRIPEVEMTSQGAGPSLNPFTTTPAERACLLRGNIRIQPAGESNEVLSGIHAGDRAAYKYFDFGEGADSISVKLRPGLDAGGFNIRIGQPWGPLAGYVPVDVAITGETERSVGIKIEPVTGLKAVWFLFYGVDGTTEPGFEIDEFQFHRR